MWHDKKQLHVISLGAGVQSTTMALLAAHGWIQPMPDCAIFADTGWEPTKVYNHLNWLCSVLPFPVHRVSVGDIRTDVLNRSNTSGGRFAAVPWFIKNSDGSKGMGRRQCTKEYKLTPIRRKVRELLGGKTPRGGCLMAIGISTDEALRMKPSMLGYVVNWWPLIDMEFSRADCLAWLARYDYPIAPKSACLGCPFHSDAQWQEIKDNPAEWADVLAVDAAIRNQPGFRGQQFMHAARIPIDQVDFKRAKGGKASPNHFINDCEGMCGV